MKPLILAVLLSLGCSPVTAQEMACLERSIMIERLAEKFDETIQAVGTINPKVFIEFYANPETGTWTIITTGTDGISCMPGAGGNWQSVEGKPAY